MKRHVDLPQVPEQLDRVPWDSRNRDIWVKITRLRHQLLAGMRGAGLPAPVALDPTEPQSLLLSVLVERGPLSVAELTDVSGQTQANTSYLVAKLTRSGLVKRRRDARDRRRTHIYATPDAERLARYIRTEHERSFNAALSNVPGPLVERLNEALAAVLAAMATKDEQ
jgi:DNA-binding MarR family transcriptional regulator